MSIRTHACTLPRHLTPTHIHAYTDTSTPTHLNISAISGHEVLIQVGSISAYSAGVGVYAAPVFHLTDKQVLHIVHTPFKYKTSCLCLLHTDTHTHTHTHTYTNTHTEIQTHTPLYNILFVVVVVSHHCTCFLISLQHIWPSSILLTDQNYPHVDC